MPSPSMTLRDAARSGFWKNSLAASLAVGLHAIVLALLVHGWSLEKPPVEQPAVLRTQLVMLPPAPQPQATEPVAAPTPLPEPVAEAPIQPVKPAIDPQIQAQKLEQAVLARKRVEDKKRELQAEQQRQRQETEKRTHDLEQQRQAQEQAQRAEQSRLAAERARQQATQVAADSRQYLPLSKDAPDYPQRALDKNIEGDCTVEYTVNPQGKIENPKVLDGCHPLFMRPSLAAANTFRYQPRIVDGHAVAVPAVRNTFHYRIK
ncbi:TonB family protein [Erwinia sp. TH29]|nr:MULTISPECIES: energy transducer TonB [unclassified Erwinia]MBK5300852.1 TonB family protein [Bacillus sp. TH86]MBK5320621.1 TonB family protein [Bacillus sp. TH59]MBK5335571.1 TonB family protein [Bacillus sp. TH57]MBK5315120.1 TonB family protein [Erwinia sp. TH79]MBK5419980.1 TonB family protein [Erwinia sp. TH29]